MQVDQYKCLNWLHVKHKMPLLVEVSLGNVFIHDGFGVYSKGLRKNEMVEGNTWFYL